MIELNSHMWQISKIHEHKSSPVSSNFWRWLLFCCLLANAVNLGHKYGSLHMRKLEMIECVYPLNHVKTIILICVLMSLNIICILAFHKNVISNTSICLFCSFYRQTTFVREQKCALFFRSFDHIKIYCLKMVRLCIS